MEAEFILLNSLSKTHGIGVTQWKRVGPITHMSQERNLAPMYSIHVCACIDYVENKLLCLTCACAVDARWAHIPHVLES